MDKQSFGGPGMGIKPTTPQPPTPSGLQPPQKPPAQIPPAATPPAQPAPQPQPTPPAGATPPTPPATGPTPATKPLIEGELDTTKPPEPTPGEQFSAGATNLGRGNIGNAASNFWGGAKDWAGGLPDWGKFGLGAGGGALIMMLLQKLFGKRGEYTEAQVDQAYNFMDQLSEHQKQALWAEGMAHHDELMKAAYAVTVVKASDEKVGQSQAAPSTPSTPPLLKGHAGFDRTDAAGQQWYFPPSLPQYEFSNGRLRDVYHGAQAAAHRRSSLPVPYPPKPKGWLSSLLQSHAATPLPPVRQPGGVNETFHWRPPPIKPGPGGWTGFVNKDVNPITWDTGPPPRGPSAAEADALEAQEITDSPALGTPSPGAQPGLLDRIKGLFGAKPASTGGPAPPMAKDGAAEDIDDPIAFALKIANYPGCQAKRYSRTHKVAKKPNKRGQFAQGNTFQGAKTATARDPEHWHDLPMWKQGYWKDGVHYSHKTNKPDRKKKVKKSSAGEFGEKMAGPPYGSPYPGPAVSTLMATLAGGMLGAPVGGAVGGVAGAGRGNMPEGVGRGVIRGGATGAGALGGAGLARAAGGGDLAALLAALAGGGAGYFGSGQLLGPAQGDKSREEARAPQPDPQEEEMGAELAAKNAACEFGASLAVA